MATFLPNEPVGAITPQISRVMRALKSLPDKSYIVWHRLNLNETDGPEFLILRKDHRAAFLSVSNATLKDIHKMVQPELIPAGGECFHIGSKEEKSLKAFQRGLSKGDGIPLIPGLIAFPDLREKELHNAYRFDPPNGAAWLSGDRLRPDQILPFIEEHISQPLSKMEIGLLREVFTPEVIIPQQFTVRASIDRNIEPGLNEYLLDYRQEWMLKCDLDLNEQLKRTSRDFGVRLINGVAGSGKSLIIIYRAMLLRRLFPKKRILVLTHNAPLIRDLKRRYEILSHGDGGIEWRTFTSWCMTLLPNDQIIEDRIGMDARTKLITEVWRQHLSNTTITPTMLQLEIDWIKDQTFTAQSEYLNADRTGRGFALQQSMRQRILDALADYSKRLSERGKIDWADIPQRIWRLMCSGKIIPPQMDVILVDEAQFFAPIWFEIIKKVINPSTGHLFLVADPTQGFLKRGQSWISSGLEVRGRSLRLERSYRTSRQILDFATSLYQRRLPQDDEDIVVPNMMNMPDGVVPVILHMTSPQDEITRVTNEITNLVEAGVPKSHILVIHTEWMGAETILRRLEYVLGKGAAVDPKGDHAEDQIRVCTLNAVTGLESPIVFLMGLHLLYDQEQSLRISDEERVELMRDNTRKIYMAITRAGQRVVITYCGEMPAWLTPNRDQNDEEPEKAAASSSS